MMNCANMSEQQCRQAERFSNLLAIKLNLECAEDALKDEGLLLNGTVHEMIEQVAFLIRQAEEDWV